MTGRILSDNDSRSLDLSTRVRRLRDLLLSNDLRRGASLCRSCEGGAGDLWQGGTSNLRRGSYLSSTKGSTSKHDEGVNVCARGSISCGCLWFFERPEGSKNWLLRRKGRGSARRLSTGIYVRRFEIPVLFTCPPKFTRLRLFISMTRCRRYLFR